MPPNDVGARRNGARESLPTYLDSLASSAAPFMQAAGFEHCERREFGDSRIEPCPDSPHREQESLYVEAVKAD